jgi:hypothetical protein
MRTGIYDGMVVESTTPEPLGPEVGSFGIFPQAEHFRYFSPCSVTVVQL